MLEVAVVVEVVVVAACLDDLYEYDSDYSHLRLCDYPSLSIQINK